MGIYTRHPDPEYIKSILDSFFPEIKRFDSGTPETSHVFVHNRNNRQVAVWVQKDDGSGNAGKAVMAQWIPTPGNELNAITISCESPTRIHALIIG